jgi:tetratricopeptide (TPR) repeat protein
MRSHLLLILLIFALTTKAFAQQIDLHGEVSIQNSRYSTGKKELVPDAQISADFTLPQKSGANGRFTLTFVGVKNGESVALTVLHSKLVVVNQREVGGVTLGRKPLLSIYMSTPEKLLESQTSLYNVADHALRKEYERKIAVLKKKSSESDALAKDLSKQLNQTSLSLEAAKELLNSKLEDGLRKARGFAKELARVNLDDASPEYIRAYELWKKGDLDGASKALNIDNIDAKYEQSQELENTARQKVKSAAEDLIQSKLLSDQAQQEYRFKAHMFEQKFQFDEARDVWERILPILEKDYGTASIQSQAFRLFLVPYYGQKEKQKAFDLLNKNIQQTQGADSVRQGYMFLASKFGIAQKYLELGEYSNSVKSAIELKNDINRFQAVDLNDSLRLFMGFTFFIITQPVHMMAETAQGNSETHVKMKEEMDFISQQLLKLDLPKYTALLNDKFLNVYQQILPDGNLMQTSHSIRMAEANISRMNASGEDYTNETINLYESAINEYYKKGDSLDYSLLRIYSGLALVHSRRGTPEDLTKALTISKKALKLLRSAKTTSSEFYNKVYHRTSMIFLKLNLLDSALVYAKKIELDVDTAPIDYLISMGNIYWHRNEIAVADKYFKNSIKKVPTSDQPPFAKALDYRAIADFYIARDSFQLAEVMYLHGLDQFDQVVGVKKKGLYSFYAPLALIKLYYKDYNKSIEYYEMARKMILNEKPDDPYRKIIESEYALVHRYVGLDFLDSKDYKNALESFNRAEELAPNLGTVNFSKAHALLLLGRYPEAIISYKRAISNRKNHLQNIEISPSAEVNLFNEIALSFKGIQQYDSVLVYTSKAIDLAGGQGEMESLIRVSLRERGFAYYKKGNFMRSKQDFKFLLTKNPAMAEKLMALDNLGAISREDKLSDSTFYYSNLLITTAGKEFESTPEVERAYIKRAASLAALNQPTQAILDYKYLFHRDSVTFHKTDYLMGIAKAFDQLKNIDSSQAYYSKTISMAGKKFPNYTARAHLNRGYNYASSLGYVEAIRDFQAAMKFENNKELHIYACSELGRAYSAIYRYDSAAIYYQETIRLTRHESAFSQYHRAGWSGLGVALDRTGNYKDAIDVFKGYILIDTSQLARETYYNNCGISYIGLKELEMAKTFLENYDTKNAGTGRSHRNWAMYYAMKEDIPLSLEYLKKALQSGYTDLYFLRSDPRFINLRKDPMFASLMSQVELKIKR